jgi:hypothetical protein
MKARHIRAYAGALLALTGGTLFADYVDFTGLDNSAATFNNGGNIINVHVDALGGTGSTSGLRETGFYSGVSEDVELFRFEQPKGYANEATLTTTFTFDSVQIFSVVAFTLNSNMNASFDLITFEAIGASETFEWVATEVTNGTTTGYAGGPTITFSPTSSSFLGFNLTPDEAISGFTVTLTSKAGATPFNSAQFKLDVVPEPTAVASLFAAGLAFTLIRFRRRQATTVH